MLQRIREYIRVAVIHGPGSKLSPVWFDWKRRKHIILEVTYHWRHWAGSDLMLHYAVTDGTALYELVYNATEQLWLLESVDADQS
ncbi:hypothetical protein KI809_09235 [Geobacter pelophilus]|jgi:hypothetical protein|uniref:Uncharacterized protein n=1 Tax=Geoanaerobacter pelophilus TaxID=60036 RepID=A0AAW4LBB4_9BACT|nr:hypothetical protein [Geoanaerobacter pelophilus]MBT0664481.1 hypothetical protein [Geoanaerobacter pelophilus]